MIQLYRAGSMAFKLDSKNPAQLRMVTKAQLDRGAMEKDAVDISIVSVIPISFEYRDYILVDGRPYFLNVLPKVEKAAKRKLTYNLTFEGGMYELGRVAFTMAGLHGWDYIGTLYDFCLLVVNEMNRNSLVIKGSDNKVLRYMGYTIGGYYYWRNVVASDTHSYFTTNMIPSVGDDIYPDESTGGEYPTVSQIGGAWTLDFEEEWNGKIWVPVMTEEKNLTYERHTCLAVLQDLVAQWEEWEFYVEVKQSDLCNIDSSIPMQCGGKIILRRKGYSNGADRPTGIYINSTNTTRTMSYGKVGGISKITREYPNGFSMPSRIYFYGGTQNLPTTYRNTRLCLPSASKEQSYKDTGFNDNASCEAVKVFDDIYPASKPFVVSVDGGLRGQNHFYFRIYKSEFFDLNAHWKDPNEVTQSEYGSYAEWLLYYGTGNSVTDRQRYLLYYYEGNTSQEQASGFPKNCYIIDDVKITFQTGDLAGMTFSVHEFDSQSNTYYEINCNRVGVESPFEDVTWTPNGDLMCKAGDKFIVEGCLMPASYVYANFGSGNYAAETLLDEAADAYIDDLSQEIKIGVEVSQDYIDTNSAVFRLYDGLKVGDADIMSEFGSTYFKVMRVVYDLLKGSYKIEIDDGRKANKWSAISRYMKLVAGNNERTA